MENPLETRQFEDWFLEAEHATRDARLEAARARDYFDGRQLTDAEVEDLRKNGQAPIVINRTRRKIEYLKGLEIKQRTDPKAFPRTPQHAEEAEAATDAIRFVCDNQDWDEIRSEVYENFLVEGFGGCEIVHEQGADGAVEVVVNHYPWDRLFYDPHSRKHDFSDARYKGVVIWMDHADFKRDFPKHADVYDTMTAEHSMETFADRPYNSWIDINRKRIRVLLMWYRDKTTWKWVRFIRGQVIEAGESPYLDDKKQSVCPLEMVSAFVGRNNDRYGIVRDMFDPQDEVNKRRSKALHSITSRQTMSLKGALKSTAAMKAELAKPNGHVEVESDVVEEAARIGMKPFEILPNGDQTQGHLALLQEAKAEIDLLGANSALEGESGSGESGRAILAKQQGGMVEIAALLDRLHRFTRTVYRHIWMRIKQFWTEERWVRVTDDEATARFVGINQPVTLADYLQQVPIEAAQGIAIKYGLMRGDPRLQTVVGVKNNVQQLDVDIILEEVPDRVTLEGEAFEALLKYAQTGAIPPAVLIEADPVLPIKKKEKLLEMMQNAQPSPQEQVNLQKTQSEVAENMANAQRMQVEAQMPRLA